MTLARRGVSGIAVAAVLTALSGTLAGCFPTFAKLTEPGTPRCQESLRGALEAILVEEEEAPETAAGLAASTARALAEVDLGPRPFQISAPSGVDYLFFIEEKDEEPCLLRLVAWQKGFVRYSNNLTYIATRPLPDCPCEP